MTPGLTRMLPETPDVLAPDGSEVRILCTTAAGSMAHFRLPAGEVSRAVRHRTVEEIWYVLAGEGAMWRSEPDGITRLAPGTCLTIPVATSFQFRASDTAALEAVAVTMPPWPGADEAECVAGPWTPTVQG